MSKRRNNKIKYFPFTQGEIKLQWTLLLHKRGVDDGLVVCNNPTKYNNIPNGRYYIRGDVKGQIAEYCLWNNIWYKNMFGGKTPDSIKQNRFVMLSKYPNLTEKEWDVLRSDIVYPRLSKEWQSYVDSYLEDRRNRKFFIHYKKFANSFFKDNSIERKFNGKTFLSQSRIVEAKSKIEVKSFVESALEYFANTPRSKIEADWKATEDFDNIGCTVEDFIDNTKNKATAN